MKEIEAAMSAPGFYENRDQAQPLIDRHQTLMWELGDLMHQWEELSESQLTEPDLNQTDDNCNLSMTVQIPILDQQLPLQSCRCNVVDLARELYVRVRHSVLPGTAFAPSGTLILAMESPHFAPLPFAAEPRDAIQDP